MECSCLPYGVICPMCCLLVTVLICLLILSSASTSRPVRNPGSAMRLPRAHAGVISASPAAGWRAVCPREPLSLSPAAARASIFSGSPVRALRQRGPTLCRKRWTCAAVWLCTAAFRWKSGRTTAFIPGVCLILWTVFFPSTGSIMSPAPAWKDFSGRGVPR